MDSSFINSEIDVQSETEQRVEESKSINNDVVALEEKVKQLEKRLSI